jgi:copper chaperone
MKLHVDNMKCGGCVTAVKELLESLPGSQEVVVDLDGKWAQVQGNIDLNQAIASLTEKGYPARSIEQ